MSVDGWQPKTKIGVQLTTTDGQNLLGFVFCGNNESVRDVLNDKRPYLLFQSAPRSTEMVNKHSIMRAQIVDHHSREIDLVADTGSRGAVSLTYANGAEVAGEIVTHGDQRVSDIINQDDIFFLFLPDEGSVNYVSTAFLSRVLIRDTADDTAGTEPA
jgi:hypothetical protein